MFADGADLLQGIFVIALGDVIRERSRLCKRFSEVAPQF
jgi:hypothetical protein